MAAVRRAVTKAWICVFVMMALPGCAPTTDSLPGTYVARYTWGTDTLELHRDLTFKQLVQGGGPTQVVTGTWRVEREGVDVRIILVECLYGHSVPGSTRGTTIGRGTCNLVVANWWGTIEIGGEGVAPWRRVAEP